MILNTDFILISSLFRFLSRCHTSITTIYDANKLVSYSRLTIQDYCINKLLTIETEKRKKVVIHLKSHLKYRWLFKLMS